MSESSPHRLPRAVRPIRYELQLEPDLDAATFAGTVAIEAAVDAVTSEIVLNAADLEIDAASVSTGTSTHEPAVVMLADHERLVLDLGTELAPGPVTIDLTFRGVLNDQLRGFYRSSWTDDDGREHVLATTQFESTNARRAFPCFDEPDRKAVFGVSISVPPGLDAVSCGPEVERRPLDDGRSLVRFGDTMAMSTYLVAFVVGELEMTEPVEVRGVPLRVVHVPGKGPLAHFALDCGAFCLGWLADYFDIAYPGDKLDLVAIPDFAFGAMENLGCVTFREALLLTDPDEATQAELGRIGLVIAHELAHMWFGDLVTMEWWDGIWLKEAFATFMELACIDAWKPEWRQWEQFTVDRAAALDTDTLHTTRAVEFPVRSPEEAEAMYDILTYEKGASIVRMLEQYLTPDRFRDGVRAYLSTHAYGNTRNSDLWDAIEAATGDPVRSTMDTWILQGGHPVIEADVDERGLRLQQRRNLYLDGDDEADQRRWSVPIVVRAGHDVHRRLLVDRRETILLDDPHTAVVNAGGHGFYRVDYGDSLRQSLLGDAAERLTTVERFGLVDDTWAAVLSGRLPASEFMALARSLAFEDQLPVWRALGTGLRAVGRLVADTDLPRYRDTIVELVRPALDIAGLEPADGEGPLQRQLRGLLVELAGASGHDAEVIGLARSWEAAPATEPELAAASVRVVAAHGTDDDYARFVDRFRSPRTPQEQLRYLYALALFPHGDQLDRTLSFARNEVRSQNLPFLLAQLLGNRDHGPATWSWASERWDELTEQLPTNTISRLLSGITWLVTEPTFTDVIRFVADHPVPSGQPTIDQYVEKLRVHAELRRREISRIGAALS